MKNTGIRIPHFTFTHHRIGLNQSTQYTAPPADAELVPLKLPAGLSDLDQDRCLGLAYFGFPENQTYRARAFELLQNVYQAGLRDSAVTTALAALHYEMNSDDCISLANEALQSDSISSHERANALTVIGDMHFLRGRFAEAFPYFQELVTLYRRHDYWIKLGICQSRLKDSAAATVSFENAVKISPGQVSLRKLLADHYDNVGQPQQAIREREILRRLRTHDLQFPDSKAIIP